MYLYGGKRSRNEAQFFSVIARSAPLNSPTCGQNRHPDQPRKATVHRINPRSAAARRPYSSFIEGTGGLLANPRRCEHISRLVIAKHRSRLLDKLLPQDSRYVRKPCSCGRGSSVGTPVTCGSVSSISPSSLRRGRRRRPASPPARMINSTPSTLIVPQLVHQPDARFRGYPPRTPISNVCHSSSTSRNSLASEHCRPEFHATPNASKTPRPIANSKGS